MVFYCAACDYTVEITAIDTLLECKSGKGSRCGLKFDLAAFWPAPTRAEQIAPERGRTHGPFSDNADFAIQARNLARCANGWNELTRSQQLALEEILLKIGRIVSAGNAPGGKEHWDDIEGYSKLGGKDCV